MLNDGAGVIGGQGLQRACRARETASKICDKSVLRAGPIQACRLRTESQFFKFAAARPCCKVVEGPNQYGCVIFDALDGSFPQAIASKFATFTL